MTWTIPAHMGALHPVEQALTLLLAVGPFLVLAVVVRRQRRATPNAAQCVPNPANGGTEPGDLLGVPPEDEPADESGQRAR